MTKTDAIPNVSDGGSGDQKLSRSEIAKKGHETRRANEAARKAEEEARQKAEEEERAKEAEEKAKEDAEDPGVVKREPGMPDELYDMRHVAQRPASTDCSNLQRAYRTIMKENPTKFTQEKAKLEAEWRNRKEGRKAEDEPDMGQEKAREIVNKMFDRFYAKNPDIPDPRKK